MCAKSPASSRRSQFVAEMIVVVVEAHAGGRLLFRAHRDQQFELQRLLDLVVAISLPARPKNGSLAGAML